MHYHYYMVKPGDTLFKVSQQYKTSPQEIAKANNLNLSKTLYPGDVLIIPAQCPNTTNTTRVCGNNFRETQVSVAGMTFAGVRPVTVYLASSTIFPEAVITSPLIHHPIDGPILLTDPTSLDPMVGAAIRNLNPTGIGEAQVVLVGNISRRVAHQIRAMGFSVRRIIGHDEVFSTAYKVLQELGNPQDVFLISTDPHAGGQVATSFSAHHGTPILLTQGTTLPKYTRLALESISNPRVYIVGINGAIPESVITEVGALASFVDIISGVDLYTLAVNFSRYISPVNPEIGWAKTEPDGHAFSFTLPTPWQFMVTSISFSHMGKHTPFLFVNSNDVPTVTEDYIRNVNPQSGDRPPFMHGFIIGNRNVISLPVQHQLHLALSIDMDHMMHQMDSYMIDQDENHF